MLLILQLSIFFLFLLITLNFFANWWCIKVVSPNLKVEKSFPLVSVLIPARNEANNITDCLKSLQTQTYPNLEIIVLDDESQDETSLQVNILAKEDSRIKLLKGQQLPANWVGKCWACHQLSEVAKGEWLLFTDADTRFKPNAISASLAYARLTKADLLSLLPKQLANTTSIKLIIPLLYFTFYTFFPGFFLSRTKTESISAAIGQFLLFNQQTYQAINGHKSVAKSIVEDLDLAKKTKLANKNLVVADGSLLLSCQMYQTFSDLWAGFTKNFFASFSYSIIKLLSFIIMNLTLYVWPIIGLLIYILIQDNKLLFVILCIHLILIYFIRFILSKRHYYPIFSTLLHPLSILVMVAISFNSIYRIVTRRGVEWKGRAYQKC